MKTDHDHPAVFTANASPSAFAGLSGWARAKSLFNQGRNALNKVFLEVCVPNRRIRRIRKGAGAQRYLKKYVRAVVDHAPAERPAAALPPESLPVWQFWGQGLEGRPALVRACMERAAHYTQGRPLRILTEKNLGDHIEIPGYLYDLKKRSRMGMAHFSDIVRTWLLVEHGGTWIDATVLLTAPLPAYITQAPLFVFQADPKADLDGLNMASYFIHAQPGQPILRDTRAALEAYWQDNDFLVNYFAFLHLFTLVTGATPAHCRAWAKVPFFSFIPVQQLQRELLNPYDALRWDSLRQATGVHKLTHKSHVLSKDCATSLEGTFYQTLFGGNTLP